MHPIERADAALANLQPIIDHMAATEIDAWQCDVVRSTDGSRNCFFGHLFQWAEARATDDAPNLDPEVWANLVWEAFESRWATTFTIYPINDGKNPDYLQTEARDRVVAHLQDLRDGRAMTTVESMNAQYQEWLAAQAAETTDN